jgi:polysaccharide chain length determinant protein (PEP-CTERM system associated)
MAGEVIEQEESKPFDIERIYDLVRRRHMQFLVPLLCGWLLVWAASWVLPVRYRSATTILVQQPAVPKNYVDPNINDDVQARLASLTQQILSRTRLLLIANRLHLYGDSRQTLTPDQIVERMRDDIGIDLVRDPQTEAISGFTVSYSAASPRIAQSVVSELTGLFINENQATLQQESESTTSFLQKQLADARTSLALQDAKVKAFQAAHEGELPSQEASNLQILSGLQAQLQTEEDALNTAQQQKVYFQSLLEQYDTLHVPTQTAGGAPTGLAAVDAQLGKMKAQLADLRVRYTEEYPAVQNLEVEIATATHQRDQLAGELDARAKAAKLHPAETSASTSMDPTTSSAVLQLQSQLQATQTDIANRKHDIATLEARINAYQARLNAEPASEEELADLTRGYEQSQTNYNDLLKKESDSAMATSMEQMQEGERFSVLDPPSLPIKPDSPNRVKLCGVGLACGLLLGLVVAGGLEFMDDRLHNEKEIEKLLPLGIIGEIPEIRTAAEEKHLRKKAFLGWTVAALVLVAIAAGSGFNYLYATGSSLNLHVLTSLRHLVGSLRHV